MSTNEQTLRKKEIKIQVIAEDERRRYLRTFETVHEWLNEEGVNAELLQLMMDRVTWLIDDLFKSRMQTKNALAQQRELVCRG